MYFFPALTNKIFFTVLSSWKNNKTNQIKTNIDLIFTIYKFCGLLRKPEL